MKQCGQCGAQNTDDLASCSACGTPLPAASALGGTLLIPPPEPPPPVENGPVAPAPGRGLKGTMIGIAPPTFTAPAAPMASTGGSEPPNGPSQPPAGRHFGATMIGMAPPAYPSPPPAGESTFPSPPPAPPVAGAAPPSAAGGVPRIASAQKTVLGVARPGIAPLNPGQPKSNPPPPPEGSPNSLTLPGSLAAPLAPSPASWQGAAAPPASTGPVSPRRPAPSRITLGATLAIVAAAMLLVMAIVAFVMLRGHGSVSARAILDAKGKEALDLACTECPDGTRVWIDTAPVEFRGGKAELSLRAPLKVGENPLVLVLERPGRSREEIALALPIEFRVRGSTEQLAQEPPSLAVLADVLSGTKLEIDGKPVTADASGAVRVTYDVSADVTGPEATVKTLERIVPYKATSEGGSAQNGQVEIRLGITPLIVDAPGASIVVGDKEIVIAGRTAPGARLSVGTQTVNLDPEGRFVSRQALDVGDNAFSVRATLADHAPRIIKVAARRSDDLEREAALARSMAQGSYQDVLQAQEGAVGRSLWVEGTLFDARRDGYSSVLLVDVKDGCKKAPCLVKLVYGVETRFDKGRKLKAAGKLVKFVDGPRTGERIPEVRADLVIAGAK